MQRLGRAVAWILCVSLIWVGCSSLARQIETEVPRIVKYSFNPDLLVNEFFYALPSLLLISFSGFVIRKYLMSKKK